MSRCLAGKRAAGQDQCGQERQEDEPQTVDGEAQQDQESGDHDRSKRKFGYGLQPSGSERGHMRHNRQRNWSNGRAPIIGRDRLKTRRLIAHNRCSA